MGISLNISFLLGVLWLIACYQFRFPKLSRLKLVISQAGGGYPLSESVLFVSTREAELEQHVDMGLWVERVSWRIGVLSLLLGVLHDDSRPVTWNGCRTGGWKVHLSLRELAL